MFGSSLPLPAGFSSASRWVNNSNVISNLPCRGNTRAVITNTDTDSSKVEAEVPLSLAVFRTAPQLTERLKKQVLFYGSQTLQWELLTLSMFHVIYNVDGGAVVNVLACKWVEFLSVGSRLAQRVFVRVLRFSSLHKNQHLQIPTSKCWCVFLSKYWNT